MAAPRHPAHVRRTLWTPVPVVLAAVAVLVAIALAVVLTMQATGRSRGASGPTGGATGPTGHRHASSAASGQAGSGASDDVTACRASLAAATVPIARAARSVAQWRLHVTAMNKMVAGTISYPQAAAAWRRSERGDLHRVHRFRAADRRYHAAHSRDDCPRGVPAACRAAADAAASALASGERTITTWRHHIREMNLLVGGRISPETAMNLWVHMWQRGMYQVVEFHARRSVAAQQDC